MRSPISIAAPSPDDARRAGAAGFDICFLHPRHNEEFPISGEGVLIELVQAPPEVVAAFARLAATST